MPHHPGLSYRFTHAITRTPADSVAHGLRAVDHGDPSGEAFRAEHAVYVKALQDAGVKVETLPKLEAFPDSCFVEDPAFCLPEGAILLRPGTESRAGEAAEIRPALERAFKKVVELPGIGAVDGGDVLMLDDTILIGLSARTDREGATAFKMVLEGWGYAAKIAQTPEGVLHFKTACAALGGRKVLATRAMIDSGIFEDLTVLEVPEDEEYAANVIRVNDVVLVPDGYPKTKAVLDAAGYSTVVVPTHEARKVDGGLSCLSLRFNPAN
ncbi:dimethylargininase [Roseibium hamelinense]|uniref:Dimethylargininase n=1 Tax=Roseibium hamelinense TaxID=150831 RepID=A0A562TJR6_9HYPH|nr:arginine deiminase-related protein [Roseibium hamelinense]MTI42620.1 dimethylarginine dimethylaminohydrolase [Roseibium hamelinense]TWI93366.1 dimethylargininase [Roseibium hamelinense]